MMNTINNLETSNTNDEQPKKNQSLNYIKKLIKTKSKSV